MTYETVSGSVLGCTDASTGSVFAVGFDVFTRIGEIVDLGAGYEGREYNVVSHSPVSARQARQTKGGYKLPPIEISMAWDQSDAGQDLLRTAAENNSVLTFELVKQGGDRRYFSAQVSKMIENLGTEDTVVAGAVTLLPQARADDVYTDLWFRIFTTP